MVHRLSNITTYIYVDESKHRDYLLVASLHVDSDLAELRAVVRDLLLPGQRYLHMKNEKAGRKRTIAAGLRQRGYHGHDHRAGSPLLRTEKDRRAACLRALIADHAPAAATHIVFDQDDTLLSFDNQRLIEYTRATDCRERLRYEHKHANTDVLLRIPDAIAWCWAKDGPWRQLVRTNCH